MHGGFDLGEPVRPAKVGAGWTPPFWGALTKNYTSQEDVDLPSPEMLQKIAFGSLCLATQASQKTLFGVHAQVAYGILGIASV